MRDGWDDGKLATGNEGRGGLLRFGMCVYEERGLFTFMKLQSSG